MSSKYLKFSESINNALDLAMKKDKKVIILGLGVDDLREFLIPLKILRKNMVREEFLTCRLLKIV